MKTRIFSGFLESKDWGEATDILYLSTAEEPLAEILGDALADNVVTVRYYITEKECTIDEAQEVFWNGLCGGVEADVGAHYSEITGFLWCDEEINIGGHDLIEELHSYVGKWLILIVDIHG